MQQLSPPHSPQSSRPSSPLLTATPQRSLPFIPPLSGDSHVPQRRLLIPTVRPAKVSPPSRLSRAKTSRLNRHTRSSSLGTELGPNKESKEWVSALGWFHIVDDQFELRGYQMYAVEKWVVERGRLINVITVYTGDPRHKIIVTVLTPFVSLNETQAQAEIHKALHLLRRDHGARPRETDYGIIMVTSLSNFRSDYNIVSIPDGNFLVYREQLYANINLLRMGCSGRSTLTLSEPSEPTKDRFLSMYCFSDPLTKSSFNYAVLELVKLVQSALSIFGMFDPSPEERNGLLCDVTVEGISRWTDTIGTLLLGIEPMERIGDPSIISALLSIVVATRNRLQALGFTQVPKDPFRDLQGFMQTVSAFQSQVQRISHLSSAHVEGCLSLQIVEAINDLYDRSKPKGSEYSSVARMIVSKIDDLTTDLNLRGSTEQTVSGHVYPTADLTTFVQMMCNMASKDTVESLKQLWTGKWKAVSRWKKARIGVDEDERERSDGKSTEDEEGSLFPSWGRQLNLDGLRNFGRSKKPSFDFVSKVKQPQSLSADEAPPATIVPQSAPSVPQLLISESGAENSPGGNPSSLGITPSPSPHSSNVALDAIMSSQTNARYATLPKRLPTRLSTVSGPLSSLVDKRPLVRHSSAYEHRRPDDDDEEEEAYEETERKINRGRLLGAGGRRHSFSIDDLSRLKLTVQCLTMERMKIDVGLCGQFLIMHRRKTHLRNIIALLEHLNTSLSYKTTKLQQELLENEAPLTATTRLRHEICTSLNTTEGELAEWTATQDSLKYQAERMEMDHLWRSVREQRARLLAVRQTIFTAPPGARPNKKSITPTHFRIQGTLDPEESILVDWLGRTVSETEEETIIPEEEIGRPPLFEEMQAWAAANAKEEKKQRRCWWPFAKDNMSDDDTATQSAQALEDR